jgi:hypothetical protein
MPSYYDEAVDMIRRLLGYDTPSAPPGSVYTQTPAKGKPGGVAGAVQANDAANARRAAQARRIGLMEDPADAVNETWNARDAAGPIVAATGAGAAMGLVGHVADNAKQSAGEPFVGTPKSETADEWRARTRKMSGRDEYAGSTAELANESRPAPVVAVDPVDDAGREIIAERKRVVNNGLVGSPSVRAKQMQVAPQSRPTPPAVPDEAEERAFTEKFKRQYLAREAKRAPPPPPADPNEQAFALKARVNELYAQGKTPSDPEVQQMRVRIQQLHDQADRMRAARTPDQAKAFASANPDDPNAQASALLADLNARADARGSMPPDAQRTLAEIRRLQRLGDQRRDAQTAYKR